MTPRSHDDGLEIDQDPAFQRREWRAQRIGRFALLAIILMAMAGVFGSGPLSSATASTRDGRLELDYHRIARHRSPESLRIRVVSSPTDSVIQLWISREYLHGLAVHWISPEPAHVVADSDHLTYHFPIASGARTMEIVFQVDADALWLRHGAIGFVGADSVSFRQFVLP